MSEAFNVYEALNVSKNQNVYGYNINHLCRLKKVGELLLWNGWESIQFSEIFPVLISSITNGSKPLACFQYGGYTYIFHEKDSQLAIIRGKKEKTFKILLKYIMFNFDHVFNFDHRSSQSFLVHMYITCTICVLIMHWTLHYVCS